MPRRQSQAPPSVPSERAEFRALPLLGGVHLLRAEYVTHRFSRHFHTGYALGCIERGAMEFHYLGRRHVAAAGQVNLVVPGETHDGHAAAPSGWAYAMFYFEPEVLAQVAAQISPRLDRPHFKAGVIDDPELARRVRLAQALAADPVAPTLARESALMAAFALWVARHAEGRAQPGPPGKERRAVRLARELLDARCAEDVSVAQLAEAAGLSPFHLIRVFRAQLGLPPHAYLVQARVNLAKALLRGPMRLADVAAAAGFADQSHLTRLFKRQVGCTPGAWRRVAE